MPLSPILPVSAFQIPLFHVLYINLWLIAGKVSLYITINAKGLAQQKQQSLWVFKKCFKLENCCKVFKPLPDWINCVESMHSLNFIASCSWIISFSTFFFNQMIDLTNISELSNISWSFPKIVNYVISSASQPHHTWILKYWNNRGTGVPFSFFI